MKNVVCIMRQDVCFINSDDCDKKSIKPFHVRKKPSMDDCKKTPRIEYKWINLCDKHSPTNLNLKYWEDFDALRIKEELKKHKEKHRFEPPY
jgi:hypothetical protein